MAVRQSKIQEIRYSKRQNLEQEAKILGNMYRDQIHAQGIDCLYYKLDKSMMHTYKHVVDENNILFHAYGYDHNPEYSLSTYMIVFMDVQNDVFNLNKYGIVPNMDVTFVFDRLDFACAVAPKFGKYIEKQIDSIDFFFEANAEDKIIFNEEISSKIGSVELTAEVSADFVDIEIGEHEVFCDVIGKGFANAEFPVNDDICKSFLYRIMNEDDIVASFKAKYTVESLDGTTLSVSGKIEGSFLFYDIASLGKYYDILHPDVGDIVTIDFPDGKNREQYEITEAVDKQIATDGINAFLHKYIWRCKARRYINSYENMEKNEANERLEEMNKYDAAVKEDLTKKISRYDNSEDDVYGGYENNNADKYDRQIADLTDTTSIVPPEMLECIFEFNAGSKLATNGYELFFIRKSGDATQIALNSEYNNKKDKLFQSADKLQWLKASDDLLVFNALDGKSYLIALDNMVKTTVLEICLNSLFDITTDHNDCVNKQNQNFYKFTNCRTILFATADELICHFNTGKTFKIA